jgi:hypothetical protein
MWCYLCPGISSCDASSFACISSYAWELLMRSIMLRRQLSALCGFSGSLCVMRGQNDWRLLQPGSSLNKNIVALSLLMPWDVSWLPLRCGDYYSSYHGLSCARVACVRSMIWCRQRKSGTRDHTAHAVQARKHETGRKWWLDTLTLCAVVACWGNAWFARAPAALSDCSSRNGHALLSVASGQ